MNYIKSTIALVLFATSTAFASISTPAFTNYIITVRMDMNSVSFDDCAQAIRQIAVSEGSTSVEVLEEIGVVIADLNVNAHQAISKLTCVLAVEDDLPVEGLPRLGTEN